MDRSLSVLAGRYPQRQPDCLFLDNARLWLVRFKREGADGFCPYERGKIFKPRNWSCCPFLYTAQRLFSIPYRPIQRSGASSCIAEVPLKMPKSNFRKHLNYFTNPAFSLSLSPLHLLNNKIAIVMPLHRAFSRIYSIAQKLQIRLYLFGTYQFFKFTLHFIVL
ncbi:hypothetical protein SAMN05216343_11530 [Oscillibacter sp. PC13]|nr:hypothetical protein SAMN05216343_11530 [Oscillibacter sp. PC13]